MKPKAKRIRLQIRVAVQEAICEFQINECSIRIRELKKNPKCLVDMIADKVMKVL